MFYYRYYDSVDVCKIRPDHHESRMQGVFPTNAKDSMKIMKLTVFSTTEVELGLFQEGLRYVMLIVSVHCSNVSWEQDTASSSSTSTDWNFPQGDHLVGLVVKASTLGEEDPGFESCL